MKFVIDCYECKCQTVVESVDLENWVKHHAEEEPPHAVSVRRVAEFVPVPEPDDRIDAVVKRLNEHVVQTNGIYFRLERLERAQFGVVQEKRPPVDVPFGYRNGPSTLDPRT
jgi:hypothetical protein